MALTSTHNIRLTAYVFRGFFHLSRAFSTSAGKTLCSNAEAQEKKDEKGFFTRFFGLQTIETPKAAHSQVLTDTGIVYELQFHDVKPECVESYENDTGSALPALSDDANYPGKLLGSWQTEYGPLDQFVHLWQFNGYKAVAKAEKYLDDNQDYISYSRSRNKMLKSRHNQLLQHFSFWGEPRKRQASHIYELRTYHLKPGTLIEWGNNWGRAIHIRQKNNEAVAGLFSQIGDLYIVHHLWAYENLPARREIREDAWRQPGWDECVANTVPLIRRMSSQIMKPTKYSEMQ